MMMSINLKCQNKYLPTSATNWNFSYYARTLKFERITINAIRIEKVLTLMLGSFIIRVNKLLFKGVCIRLILSHK